MPVVQSARIENSFHRFGRRKYSCGGEFVPVRHSNNFLDSIGAQLGSKASGLGKMPAGSGLCGRGRLARAGHGQQIRIWMLDLGQTLRSLHYSFEALVVELVGGGAGSASAERRPHRNRIIFLGDILMDGVVGKTGQSEFAAIDHGFDLICGRMLFYLIEDFGGFFFGQHSALACAQSKLPATTVPHSADSRSFDSSRVRKRTSELRSG